MNAASCKTFIDIGASTGLVSKAVHDQFNYCLVVEPSAKKIDALRTALSGAENCMIAHCALAGEHGSAAFYESGTNPDDAGVFPRSDLKFTGFVEVDTLDGLVSKTLVSEP